MTDLPSAAARDLVPGAAATLALVTALTANALTGTAAGQTLRDPAPGSARVRLWSDPGTWPAGVLPGPNTDVFIPAGRTVWLDFAHLGARVDVRSITVQGELRVAFGGGALEANYVLVDGGTFGVGTPERRYPAPVRITLTHDPARTNYGSATNPGDMLDQALVVQNGGALELHGIDHGTSWTQLAETAFAGDTQIRLTEPVDWLPGHEIVLASTDFDLDQAETANVLQVTGDVVQLSAPLQHMHWGQIEGPYANGMSVDERGEVGLLSRSIVVEGTPFVAPDGRTMGGHTMVHRGPNGFSGPAPRMDVSWVEFTGLGREGTLGRYPLHAHLASSLPDTRFHACSVRNSFNRVVSIHSVLDVEVTDCVAHEHIGHGYYFEGLGGVRNVMNGNLGLGTRSAAPGREILTSDLEPGTFWLENPLNEIRD
ncbi:MAG: G8 domain-containing protein, partial [Planctomycetota bacterium]